MNSNLGTSCNPMECAAHLPKRIAMAKNQNTIEKRRREMEKKRKAEEKKERRRKKKEQSDEQPALGESSTGDSLT
jgi:hypothetical protein